MRAGFRGERHAVEPVVAGRREQTQGIPAVAPGIANLSISIQDREGDIETGKMITDGKAGLAAANDDDLDPLRGVGWEC